MDFLSSCPVSTLHIRTLQSPLPPKSVFPLQEATIEPSAEMLTPLTCELFFGFKLVTTLIAYVTVVYALPRSEA
jgi:hypothetical protein